MSIRFEPTHNPDNRFKFIPEDQTQEIIISGSIDHTFELPFIYCNYIYEGQEKQGYIKSGKVIYKQGSNIILEKNITDDMIENIDPMSNRSTLVVKLKPSETQQFKIMTLDTFVQLRLITIDNLVAYDTAHKLNVREPLKVEPMIGD